jgi:hypothetical protein
VFNPTKDEIADAQANKPEWFTEQSDDDLPIDDVEKEETDVTDDVIDEILEEEEEDDDEFEDDDDEEDDEKDID